MLSAGQDRFSLGLGAGDHRLVIPALHDRQSLHRQRHKGLVPFEDAAKCLCMPLNGAIARVGDHPRDLGGVSHAVPLRAIGALRGGELLGSLRGGGVDLRGRCFERESPEHLALGPEGLDARRPQPLDGLGQLGPFVGRGGDGQIPPVGTKAGGLRRAA